MFSGGARLPTELTRPLAMLEDAHAAVAILAMGAPLGENPRMQQPSTRFAWNGDVSLAYQVCGEGPTDLVYLQGYCSNVDVNWDDVHLARFLSGLAAHARLVITDRRGWGCSERFTPGDVPDVDTLTDDLLAVMKAAGSDRASILATYECAIVASCSRRPTRNECARSSSWSRR